MRSGARPELTSYPWGHQALPPAWELVPLVQAADKEAEPPPGEAAWGLMIQRCQPEKTAGGRWWTHGVVQAAQDTGRLRLVFWLPAAWGQKRTVWSSAGLPPSASTSEGQSQARPGHREGPLCSLSHGQSSWGLAEAGATERSVALPRQVLRRARYPQFSEVQTHSKPGPGARVARQVPAGSVQPRHCPGLQGFLKRSLGQHGGRTGQRRTQAGVHPD